MVEGKIKTVGNLQDLRLKYGDSYEIEIKLKRCDEITKITLKSKLELKFRNLNSLNENLTKEVILYLENYFETKIHLKDKFLKQQFKNNKTISFNIIFEWCY